MKTVVSILFAIIVVQFYSAAQETIEKEISYKGIGKVIMEDGSQIEGQLEFKLTDDHTVLLYKEGEKKPQKIIDKDFKTFNIGEQYFYKIQVPTRQVTGSPINDNNCKILILKSVSQSPTISGGSLVNGFTHETITGYYILFTESNTILAPNDFRCNNKKISSLVTNCDELSKKIANKEKGYVFTLIQTIDSRIEIFKKIAEEYRNCK
jgi:hypothetical protein